MNKKVSLLVVLTLLALQVHLHPKPETIRDLMKQLAYVGELTFAREVPVKYMNRKKLRAYIESFIDRDYPDETARKESIFLSLVGFTDTLIDLKKHRKMILAENAGGIYNEKTGELLVLEEYRESNMIDSLVLVHELRHALQDQYFNLSGLLGSHSDFDDRKLAILTAVEGDATFAMVKYSQEFSSIPLAPELLTSFDSNTLMSFSPISNTSLLYQTPEIVKLQLMMPYVEGLKFVDRVHKKKKWKGVNRILRSPPTSSEQILHPEKYFKREEPTAVTVSYKPDGEGYRPFFSGVIGEYYLNVLLKEGNHFFDHAQGWGGDRFEIYKKNDYYFLLWESAWDKEKFASHFFFAFKNFVEKKFKVNFRKGNVKGSLFLAGESDAGTGYFFLKRFQNTIFYARSNDREQINKFIRGGFYD